MANVVLTYSMELMSNLVQMYIQFPSTNKSEHELVVSLLTKPLVGYLYENVFKDKGTIADYEKLLQEVWSTVEKNKEKLEHYYPHLENMMARQNGLIMLAIDRAKMEIEKINQEQAQALLEPTKKPSKWNKLRDMSKAGVLVKNLQAKERNPNHMPFHAVPSKQKAFKAYALTNFLNKLEPEYYEAGVWLANHLQVLTFSELKKSIESSCKELAPFLAKYPDYRVLTVTGKSQEWMASLASLYLPEQNLLGRAISMGKQGMVAEQYQYFEKIIENSATRNFVYFDDASYSGTQLHDFCNKLLQLPCKSIIPEPLAEPIHVHIVMGFMSNKAKQQLETEINNLKLYNIHLHLHCQRTFKDIHEQCMEEYLDVDFQRRIYSVAMNQRIAKGEFTEYMKKSMTRTTMLTEWKTPDFVSVPNVLLRGDASTFNKFTKRNLKAEDIPALLDDNENKFITQIEPPYRKKPKS